MAIYNTPADAANTAVRAFLTRVGEFYLGRRFNTATGRGRADWERIRKQTFDGRCCYCGSANQKLQMEHLYMFNRAEYGLHHPGNIAPCCSACNKRSRTDEKAYVGWVTHLEHICNERGEVHHIAQRRAAIDSHMRREGYPELSSEERHAIRVIANSLYRGIKLESERSLALYKELDQAFGASRTNRYPG